MVNGIGILRECGASTIRVEKMKIPEYKILRYRAKRNGENALEKAKQWTEDH